MTAHSDERGLGGPSDRDLTQRQEAFTAKIEAALDVKAGLRDILSQSRHETFTAKVETALDVKAGLRNILTCPTIQASLNLSPAVAPPVANAAPGGSRWQASAAQRLKLRSNPRVAAASRVLSVVRNWTSACAPVRDSALDLGHVLTRDLLHDRDLVHALVRISALDRNIGLVRSIARDLGNRDLDRVSTLALARVRNLAHDLARDLDRNLDRNLPDDLAHELADTRGLVRGLVRALDHDLDLVRALDRARALDLALADHLDPTLDRARCRCLQIISNEYSQAVGTLVTVDEESLASLMDDFTTDDLSDADVREDDTELTGVRWSDGTRWPASTDIDYLKRRSDRQEDGSWIIHAGTGNVRENVRT